MGVLVGMQKFWWGMFLGTVVGVLLLFPESNFSKQARSLLTTAQGVVAGTTGEEAD